MIKTVLIADDEEHIRDLLTSAMQYLHFEVVGKAENGKEASELYIELNPDLILLDINMPGKKGFEVAKEILENNSEAFIIILSIFSQESKIKEITGGNNVFFIRKDNPLPKIVTLIRECINNYKPKKITYLKQMMNEIKEDEDFDSLET